MEEFTVGDSIWIDTEEAGMWNGWHGGVHAKYDDGTLHVKCQRFNRDGNGLWESTYLRVRPDQIRMRESKARKDALRTAEFERWGTE